MSEDELISEARILLRKGEGVGAYAFLSNAIAAKATPSSLLLRKRAELALLLDAHELALHDLKIIEARGEANGGDLFRIGQAQRMTGHLGLASAYLGRAQESGVTSDFLDAAKTALEAARERWTASLNGSRDIDDQAAMDWLQAALRLDDRQEAMRAIAFMSKGAADPRASSESWVMFTSLVWFGDLDAARKVMESQRHWPGGVAEIGMALIHQELGNWGEVLKCALKGYDLGANGYVTARLIALSSLRAGDAVGYKTWGRIAEQNRGAIDRDLPSLKQ